MELLVRTPYGDADVDLAAHGPGTRLVDLVQQVTGQAAPPVVRVDGRSMPTDATLADARLLVGSVVDTAPGDEPPAEPPQIRLVQLTDHGTGVERDLVSGHYRVGPGRRLHAGELDEAPVEQTVFELEIAHDRVRVAGGETSRPPRLDGTAVRAARDWNEGLLDAGRRVFTRRSPVEVLAEPLPAGDDGTVPYHRPPPGVRSAADLTGAHDAPGLGAAAVEAARSRSSLVWSLRPGDPGAFEISIGLDERLEPATLDLRRAASAAIVGSERFRTALCRSLLVEAATFHGPADLRVLVASSVDRAPDWEWAKWLPHLRTEGDVAVATIAEEVAAWSERFTTDPEPDRLSLVLVDEQHWWRGRDAPLRQLRTSPSVGVCLVVLSDDTTAIPGNSSTVVVQQASGDVRVHRTGRTGGAAGARADHRTQSELTVRPPLLAADLAEEAARHLAPLDDAELVRPVGPVAARRPGLLEWIGDPTAPGWVEQRAHDWSAPDGRHGPGRIVLGRDVGPARRADGGAPDDATVHLDLGAPGHVLLTAGGLLDAVDAVTTVVVGAAVQAPPDRWSFVRIGAGALSGLAHLERLPHDAGRWSDASPLGIERVIRRITEIARTSRGGRFLAIVEDLVAVRSEMPRLLDALVELAGAGDRLQLLLTLQGPPDAVTDELGAACRTRVDVWSVGALAHGRLAADGEAPRGYVPLDPLARSGADADLVLGAAVRARTPSSLERRLLRRRRDTQAEDETAPYAATAVALATTVDHLAAAARAAGDDPSGPVRRLVPPGLPAEEDLTTLLARWPGDAVPLGSVDHPESDAPMPYWWCPLESGSLLTIGSRRSAHDHVLSALVVGVAARFSADDLHVYQIAAYGPRRRAVARLPHCGGVVDPRDAAAVDELIVLLEGEAARRRGPGRRERHADVVVLVDDVGTLRRPLGETPVVDRLAQLAADSSRTGIHVVAAAVRAEECRPLVHACDELLVGALTDPEDVRRLALPESAVVGERGRCWSRRTDRIVQLPRPPADLESAVLEHAPEPATSRPPHLLGR
jgi:S-DNA-T family DNA segregation ATPase FtsK/SpoIIIE